MRMRLNRHSHLTALTRPRAQAALLFLFAGTIALSIALNLLLTITGITSLAASGDAAAQAGTALAGIGLATSIALYGIVTPLAEEFVFRGLLYSALYTYLLRKIGPTASTPTHPADGASPGIDPHAAIGILTTGFQRRPFLIAAGISSLLFGIYHMNLAQGIYAFLMGIAFCLAYELTGQFLSAWILHAGCNVMALVLSQSVNGTNAFTHLCTVPWTAAFLAITVVSFACLYRIFHK